IKPIVDDPITNSPTHHPIPYHPISNGRLDTVTIRLAVIGAGPGGYAAAFHAADLGMQVTLIDVEPNPGGVCTFKGCIPSKALLHAAKVLDEAKHSDNFGVSFAKPKIDLDKLRSWKD